mmetsp:Transcript_11034/g.25242  ORF Transcript_11034/g.25242 Transcript_11034/m.25242 type:complete len:87 (+) Transcript_11034:4486-4746(+)
MFAAELSRDRSPRAGTDVGLCRDMSTTGDPEADGDKRPMLPEAGVDVMSDEPLSAPLGGDLFRQAHHCIYVKPSADLVPCLWEAMR